MDCVVFYRPLLPEHSSCQGHCIWDACHLRIFYIEGKIDVAEPTTRRQHITCVCLWHECLHWPKPFVCQRSGLRFPLRLTLWYIQPINSYCSLVQHIAVSNLFNGVPETKMFILISVWQNSTPKLLNFGCVSSLLMENTSLLVYYHFAHCMLYSIRSWTYFLLYWQSMCVSTLPVSPSAWCPA